jgi:hypothetical protein
VTRSSARVLLGAVVLLATATAHGQDLGHRLHGTLGIDAGRVSEPGLYVIDKFVLYSSTQVRDQQGHAIPGHFDLRGVADAIGLGITLKLDVIGAYYSAAAAYPFVWVNLKSDRLAATVDRSGVADISVQPIKLGWRTGRLDVVTAYSLLVPTSRAGVVGSPLARTQLTHELDLGGTVFFDRARRWRLSALASYFLNQSKWDVDATRGDLIAVQGGAAVRLWRVLDLGIAGYGAWQVRDHRGADVPPELKGIRERSYGLGPEIAVFIPVLRLRIDARYEREFLIEARPEGQIVVVTASFIAWRPRTKR